MIVTTLLVIAAYLLGSLSSAVWIGKKFYGIDIREHGSHNAGATNILRVLGKRAAIPVFAIDSAKGFAAVMLFHLAPSSLGESLAIPHEAFVFYLKLILTGAVTLGHIFPIFAGFRGGKGVATMAGAVLAVNPPAVLLCMATFLIVLGATHYVSLSSVTAAVMFPVYNYFVFGNHYVPMIVFSVVLSIILIITHRKNLRRIVAGTESRIYYFPARAHRRMGK